MGLSASRLTRRALLGAGVILAAGQRRRLAPVDESKQDASFAQFLVLLRAVANGRDGAGLQRLCAPDVITGFGSPPGPAELVKNMQAGGWAHLQTVLKLGAARYEQGFAMPYVFAKFPEDLETFEHVVTIRAGAVLRSAGRADAAVVCPLDYDILKVDDARPVKGWIQAARLDGPRGWVAEADVRSAGSERMLFEKKSGAWKITAWAAGD
jgi:hypothetical protein